MPREVQEQQLDPTIDTKAAKYGATDTVLSGYGSDRKLRDRAKTSSLVFSLLRYFVSSPCCVCVALEQKQECASERRALAQRVVLRVIHQAMDLTEGDGDRFDLDETNTELLVRTGERAFD